MSTNFVTLVEASSDAQLVPKSCYKPVGFVIKLVQIVLAFFAMLFHVVGVMILPNLSFAEQVHPFIIAFVFCLVTTAIASTYIQEPKMPDILIQRLHWPGAILFMISSAMALKTSTEYKGPEADKRYVAIAAGVILFLSGILYAVDCVIITIRKMQNVGQSIYE